MSPPTNLVQSSPNLDSDIQFSLDEDEEKYLSNFNSIKKTENMIEDDMIGVGSFSSNGSNLEPVENLNRSQTDTGIDSEMLSDLSISPSPVKNSERNNSFSVTSDDMSDFDLGNSEDLANCNNPNTTIVYQNSSDDLDEENVNRRDTLLFVVKNDSENEIEANFKEVKTENSDNLTTKFIAHECASLSSVYSSYSQFDFVNRSAPSPPPPNDSAKSQTQNSLSSFLGIFSSKKSNSQNKFDILTSKLFGFKNKTDVSKNQIKSLSSADVFDNSGSSSKISNSINNSCQDFKVPDSMLIFENRPRYL